ncbi:MAG: GtrA family protein [Clostridia bacterium]|nr:GtrA family protein [Clostridia bacterium]
MDAKRLKQIFLYIIFGVLTTLINIAVYSMLYYGLFAENLTANILAWLVSVVFAYITNRKWVFESKRKEVFFEVVKFFGSRVATGAVDMLLMYIFVDLIKFEGGFVKTASNLIVIVLNYLLSRYHVFKA